eukprot:CAMPEP_0204604594 /NCGR_PEP_ID=MMETSP0661-20131031/57964_1 /ASSEMBLY_ACC=CAM_ASM_000606 /TAXON_ID=109239 /ORGANISM="Alexandrium margalefi, Strain AMGDE01CS-322" /LENGTH=37 /DNA_ID= /DNA_START= /DNA_END= /DNA_ORIENTATION=
MADKWQETHSVSDELVEQRGLVIINVDDLDGQGRDLR